MSETSVFEVVVIPVREAGAWWYRQGDLRHLPRTESMQRRTVPVCASVATQSGGCAYLQSVRAQEPRSHSRHAYRGREVGLKRWGPSFGREWQAYRAS